jgi:GMP synthase (glutamine-hydrolysing)
VRRAPRRFAVIDCEDREHWRGHERLWIDRLARDGDEWRSYRAWAGELPDPAELDGAVVTGSHHSVIDPELVWLEPLFGFLRESVGAPRGPSVVGVCFGAQALARALGGRVGANRGGRFVFGAEQIALHAAFGARLGAEGVGDALSILESHGECVLELPPGAELLAHSSSAAHEVFTVGDRALAIQGHPEMTREIMVGRILPALRESGRIDPDREAAALASMDRPLDSERVLGLIGRFLEGPDQGARGRPRTGLPEARASGRSDA